MKVATTATLTLPLPNPDDWCTVDWAAKQLHRSERTVYRLIEKKVLRSYRPRVAPNRVNRTEMLWVADVLEYRDALFKSGQLLKKTGWRD